MVHSLLGFFFTAKRQERFTFQVKDVLFTDPGRFAEFASGHGINGFLANVSFVFSNISTLVEHIQPCPKSG